jgi:hypothetical protein
MYCEYFRELSANVVHQKNTETIITNFLRKRCVWLTTFSVSQIYELFDDISAIYDNTTGETILKRLNEKIPNSTKDNLIELCIYANELAHLDLCDILHRMNILYIFALCFGNCGTDDCSIRELFEYGNKKFYLYEKRYSIDLSQSKIERETFFMPNMLSQLDHFQLVVYHNNEQNNIA